jgi:hypothetical protein
MANSASVTIGPTQSPKRRHCAFCLEESTTTKTCGGCKKRAYCSVQCQRNDWGSNGQCHRIWCKVECCEEDVDWEVRECPDKRKGLGIFALRDIPPMSRLLVDKTFTWEEAQNIPRLADLCPKNGTLQEKFKLNSFVEHLGEPKVGFRISRMNHACDMNAIIHSIEDTDAAVVFSRRFIQKGDEICIAYRSFMEKISVKINHPAEYLLDVRQGLLKWGISCPSICVCQDPTTLNLILEMQRLNADTKKYGSIKDYKKTFEEAKKLIQLFNTDSRLVGIFGRKLIPLFDAYQAAMASHIPELELEGSKLMKEILLIDSSIEYPNSKTLKYYEFYSTHHRNFDPQERFDRCYKEFFSNSI